MLHIYFSDIKNSFRYEDYYYTPLELMTKYFTKEELIIIKSSPDYFGLNRYPFKNSDFEFNPTLLAKIEFEDEAKNSHKIIDQKKELHELENKKSQSVRIDMEKIRKIFLPIKKKKVIKKYIKGVDFVSHFDREIEPDEGTVEYYERKYIRYLSNKERKTKKKIMDIKLKKAQFEFLKNERMQKLEEENNVQRQAIPIINIIKKNYMQNNFDSANNSINNINNNNNISNK